MFRTLVAGNPEFHSDLTDHYITWFKMMRNSMTKYPGMWTEVLREFPIAPIANGKPQQTYKGRNGQPLATSKEALAAGYRMDEAMVKEFLRYFAYYNWQYRLCSPNFYHSLDRWRRSEANGNENEIVDKFLGGEWFIDLEDIQQSAFGDPGEIDWELWKKHNNSMLLPRWEKLKYRPDHTLLFVREPTCVNFPGFVHLLGKEYSGAEIIRAWRMLPVIKRTKIIRRRQER